MKMQMVPHRFEFFGQYNYGHISNIQRFCHFNFRRTIFFHLMYCFFSPQPSHSDKATNPEVLRWVNELAKLRKELKGETNN